MALAEERQGGGCAHSAPVSPALSEGDFRVVLAQGTDGQADLWWHNGTTVVSEEKVKAPLDLGAEEGPALQRGAGTCWVSALAVPVAAPSKMGCATSECWHLMGASPRG